MYSRFKVPPLTPFTNKKVGEALKLTYSSWSVKAATENIPADPASWSLDDVRVWLQWTVDEFSLDVAVFEVLVKEFQVSERARERSDSSRACFSKLSF